MTTLKQYVSLEEQPPHKSVHALSISQPQTLNCAHQETRKIVSYKKTSTKTIYKSKLNNLTKIRNLQLPQYLFKKCLDWVA